MRMKKITEDRWESVKSAGRKEKWVEDKARDMWLRQPMSQTLRNIVGILKRAAREQWSLLLGYDLNSRQTKAGEGTELEEKLTS